jgi:hypothetical protein
LTGGQPDGEIWRMSGESKYSPLAHLLTTSGVERIELAFAEIGQAVPGGLPRSAYVYRTWWTQREGNSAQSRHGWTSAGYRVAQLDLARQVVTFTRLADAAHPNNPPSKRARQRAVRARQRGEAAKRRAGKALTNWHRLCSGDSTRAARRLAEATLIAHELVDRCQRAQLAAAWQLVDTAERSALACRSIAWAHQRLADAGSVHAEGHRLLAADYRTTAKILCVAVAVYWRTATWSRDPGEP